MGRAKDYLVSWGYFLRGVITRGWVILITLLLSIPGILEKYFGTIWLPENYLLWVPAIGSVFAAVNVYHSLRIKSGLFHLYRPALSSHLVDASPYFHVKSYKATSGDILNSCTYYLCVRCISSGLRNVNVTLQEVAGGERYPQSTFHPSGNVTWQSPHKGDEIIYSFATFYTSGQKDYSGELESISGKTADVYRRHALEGMQIECDSRALGPFKKPLIRPGDSMNLLIRLSAINCEPIFAHIYIHYNTDKPVAEVVSQGLRKPKSFRDATKNLSSAENP